MLFPALVLPLLTARAAPGPAHPPDGLPPWGAALLATVGKMEEKISSLQTTIHDHSARIRELEASPEQPGDGSTTAPGRRLQQPPSPGRVVHIHSTSVAIPEGPGWRTSGNYNGGHRRVLQSPSCGSVRAQAVQTECCNERTEYCSSGVPRTCNPGCAAVFLPFWSDCAAPLHLQGTPLYQQTVALCRASAPAGSGGTGTAGSVVHEFRLVCSDGSTNCVPQCDSRLHGDLLLLAVNGEDSKYSCELHHGQYSWVGPAAEGGYIGGDALTFVSAVVSGAAGLFMLTLTTLAASISTLLTVEPGQVVAISGAVGQHTTWGTGGFSVLQRGVLTLGRVSVNGPMTVAAGGTLQLNDVVLGTLACLTAHPGSSVGLNRTQTPPVCAQCNPIAHCHTAQCTTRGSICSQCDAGYYSFRHDDSASSCYSSTMGIAQVGVTANAVGDFYFGLSGGSSIPADLAAAAATITVPRRASLFLVGTNAEAIAASFSVQGVLSLTALSIRGSGSRHAISVAAGGSLTVSASHLVDSAAGDRTQPFPCNGTLATGCAGPHAAAVTIGSVFIYTANPLVCDAESGRCSVSWSGRGCPAGATAVAGAKYCSAMQGFCTGPGTHREPAGNWIVDHVNNIQDRSLATTRAACEHYCDTVAACVGYAYLPQPGRRLCWLFGPGVEHLLPFDGFANAYTTTTIGGSKVGQVSMAPGPLAICVAVAGRN
eukprot:COSAG01_NODE_6315_length_3741_cov_10.035969_2_plen_710_part_00